MIKTGCFLLSLPLVFIIWKNNHKIFFLINGFYSDFLGYPMIFLTAMADGLFVIMIASVLYGRKKGYYWSFLVSFLVSSSIVNLIKNVYSTGRPLAYYPLDKIYYAGDTLMYQSFPSGHAAAAMVLARYLMQGENKVWKAIFFSIGILCAVSRIYIGVHFPYDVIMGASLGFFIAHGIFFIAKKKSSHSKRPEYRYNPVLVSLVGMVTALLYLLYHNENYAPLSQVINITALIFLIYFIFHLLRKLFQIYNVKSNGNAK